MPHEGLSIAGVLSRYPYGAVVMLSSSHQPQGSRSATLAEFVDPRLSHVNALFDVNPGRLALVRWFAGLVGERVAERIFGLADEPFGSAYHYVEHTLAGEPLDKYSRPANESDVALYCTRLRWAVGHLETYFAGSRPPPNPIGGTAEAWRIGLVKAATKEFHRKER